MKAITVRLPGELYRRIKHFAIDQDVSIADLVVAFAESVVDGSDGVLERARELSRERRARRKRAGHG